MAQADRESESRFKAIFQVSPLGILIADSQTRRFIYANPAICRLLGYTADELTRLGVADIHPPESLDRIEAEFDSLVRGKKELVPDIPCLRKDGTLFYANIHGTSVVVGGMDCHAAFFEDITEHKRAQERIEQQRRELHEINRIGRIASSSLDLDTVLRLILDSTTKAVNASTGMIFLKNPASDHLNWGASLGLSDEFVNNFKERPIQMGEGLTGTIAQTGKPLLIVENSSQDPRVVRSVIRQEDLNSFLGVPIMVAGELVGVMNVLTRGPEQLSEQDMTFCSAIGSQVGLAVHNAQLYAAQEQAEAALRDVMAQREMLARHVPGVIYQYRLRPDGSSHFPYASKGIEDIYGVTPEQVADDGTPVCEALHPDDRERVNNTIQTSARTLQQWRDEYRVNLPNGQTIWVEGEASPEALTDGSILWHGYIHDITGRKQVAERLEFQARLLAAVGNAIIATDLDGRVTYWNKAAEDLYGWSGDEALGSSVLKLTTARQTHRQAQEIIEYLARGEIWSGEFLVARKDGSTFLAHVSDWPVHDAAGKLTGIIGVSTDITERKQIGESLQQASDIINNMQMGLYVYELEELEEDRTLRMVVANPASGTLSGIGSEQLIGKYIDEIFPALRDLGIPKRFADVVRTGQAGEFEDFYYADDRVLEAAYAVKAFPLPNQRVGITFDNITARKQIEEERAGLSAQVHAQARQTAQILNTVPTGVLLLDATGQVLQANSVAEGNLAMLAARVAVDGAITHLGDRPLADLLTPPPSQGRRHEVKADGRTFEVIAQPMEHDSGPRLWVLVINDVTQERELQAQLQQQAQMASVGQLAAGIAHDFNNIMAVILLYTQIGLGMADVSPKLRERLEIVQQQARRASNLTQQILDFSRRAVLERRPMDLLPFLKETVRLLQRTMPENIAIELAHEEDVYTVGADPTRMQQVIMNLATNARDAMLPQEAGSLRITLSYTAAVDEIRCVTCGQVIGGKWVHITITDSGNGIPLDTLPRIFEPFFTTKEVGKGTGLGLAQVYGIVKQHEGHINVATRVGQGTTFNIYLPALQVQVPAGSIIESQSPVPGRAETVLLVEDNALLREALADMLGMLNYQTLQAASGIEALAVLAQSRDKIDLVLSDLIMPEMGGQALLHAMRAQGLTLPVVILSGHPMDSELDALQAKGLAGWLTKPVNESQLAQMLAQVLQKQSEPV
jgi:PAS domain S-box-containing protein